MNMKLKCEFCEKCQMNKNTGEFSCTAYQPEAYCRRALDRMTASFKDIGNAETRKPEPEKTCYISDRSDQNSSTLDELLRRSLFGR